jgi:ClpP class serine protease
LIAVSVNSSSGSYVQAEIITQLLKDAGSKLDVPVYTFAEDMAVGAGYYVLCTGNKVFADPHSLVGGVATSYSGLSLENFVKEYSINPHFQTSGKNKMRLSAFEKVKPEDEAWLRDILAKYHQNFKDHVIRHRGASIPRDQKVEQEVLNGEIYSGTKAVTKGLVDGLSELHTQVEKEWPGLKIREGRSAYVYPGVRGEVKAEDLMRALHDGEVREEIVDLLYQRNIEVLNNRLLSNL